MSIPGTTIQVMTLKEAAKQSPYSAAYLNLLARKRKIRAVKLGRDWVIAREDLNDYLRRQQVDSQSRLQELSKYLN